MDTFAMMRLIHKTLQSMQKDGLAKTLRRVHRWSFNQYPLRGVKERRFKEQVLALHQIEDRFTEIYKRNRWGNDESVSGHGSTLQFTANLRSRLPELFERYRITRVFDAPCGDFNWMRHVMEESQLQYVGADIVSEIIDNLNKRYGSDRIRFVHMNLVSGHFPSADLMICRDCLFHLSYRDTQAVLRNFVESGIPYLLTSTYINHGSFQNADIATGDFRLMDLLSAPYCFPSEIDFRIKDFTLPDPPREMCLWSRDQIAQALDRFRIDMSAT